MGVVFARAISQSVAAPEGGFGDAPLEFAGVFADEEGDVFDGDEFEGFGERKFQAFAGEDAFVTGGTNPPSQFVDGVNSSSHV